MASKRQDTGPPKLSNEERPVILERIKSLKSAIKELQELTPNDPKFDKWHHAAWSLIFRYSDFATHTLSFGNLNFREGEAQTFAVAFGDPGVRPDYFDSDAYQAALLKAASILSVMIQELEDAERARGGTRAIEVRAEPDPVDIVVDLCRGFHRVVRQLRQRHEGRPTLNVSDEYDVQDLIHALLTLRFDDIRAEEWTPSYAGGSSRMDFLLREEQIVVEVKKTRQKLGDREIGSQLIDDIARYKSHPNCRTLVCFVYDPDEQLRNPRGLENDLSGQTEGLNVRVVIEPRH